ncbi:MAG: hypothetical protein WBR10_05005, partial [Candidatus Acidiferrum sp.]
MFLGYQMPVGRIGLPSVEHTRLLKALQLSQKAKGSFQCSGKSHIESNLVDVLSVYSAETASPA